MKSNPELRFSDKNPPKSWPPVSLCMIVKNEQENLAGCLESVGDFAGEMIVVDTGSTDNTVKIAQSCGARVEHFTWIDDFSAARNESLKYAGGDWIFWMDADDRISPNELIRLKNALVSGRAEAYFCSIISGVGAEAGTQSKTIHLRLFPNRRGICFVNPIHEDPTPVARQLGLSLAYTNITIHHGGYTADADAMRARGVRNEQIVRRAIAAEPANPRRQYDLAAALNLQGDYQGVVEQLEPLLATPPAALDRDTALYHAFVLLISAYGKLRQPAETFQTLDRALGIFPERRHLRITAGILYWQQNRMEQAIVAFERAQTLPATSDALGYTHAPGELEKLLSRPYLLVGAPEKAKKTYLAMLAQMKKRRQATPARQLQQAQNFFDDEQLDRAKTMLSATAITDPAALRLLYRVAVREQAWGQALFYLLDAIILSEPQAGEWVEVAQVALHAGEGGIAERVCALALPQAQSVEQQVIIYNLLGMSAFQRKNPSLAIEYFIRAMVLNPENEAATNNLSNVARAVGLSPQAAIREQARQWLARGEINWVEQLLAWYVTAHPNDAEAYRLLAVTLQKLDREEDALQAWQVAQQLETS